MTESKRIKIFICGILPPPHFGHSMLYKMLMASSFPHAFETKFLNMRFWTYGTHKKVTMGKIFKLIQYYIVFVVTLIFWRPKYFLYNSSFYPMPYWKDFLFYATGIVLGSRLIIHDHGQYVGELDASFQGIKKASLRWVLKSMHASIIMGEKVRQDYAGLADATKLVVVAGTVEDSKQVQVNAVKILGKINILYFSHMSRLKGVYTAFEAMAQVLDQSQEVIVTFGGPLEDAQVKNHLEALQKKYPQRVCYKGYVEDATERTKIFRQADIFIFPTLRDVFGLVLLHAMAEALPVVASREGTIPEIVPEGTHALLVVKGDAHDLVAKTLVLVRDGSLRAAMGQANRQRFEEKYTLKQYGQAMIDAFNQIKKLG